MRAGGRAAGSGARRLALLLGGLALLGSLAARPARAASLHPNSSSRSHVTVGEEGVRVALTCQTRSLAEALPVDLDRDLRLDRRELEAGRDRIEAYLLERYTLRRDSRGEAGAGERLPGRLVELSAELDQAALLPEEWVTAELRFDAPGPPEDLLVEVHLFEVENPYHVDVCELTWGGEAPASFLFGIDGQAWFVQPAAARRGGVLGSFLRLGLEHILTGYDHLAFLAALLLASGGLRSLAGVVTAFTAAHSLTLALAALELVSVPPGLVELSIAMSIAYVGALNLLVPEPSGRWLEAFAFGLVHGLGFAGFVGAALRSEPLVLTGLLGFNLGVEVGQLGVILALALAVAPLGGDRRHGERARAWLAPRWLRRAGSLAVALCGAYWFLERAGWLGEGA